MIADDQQQAVETFEGWCVLELMGHRKLGGFNILPFCDR